MGVSQTKRFQVIDNTLAPNAQLNDVISTSEDPCNIHGLQLDVWVGTTTAGLNFGAWGLWLLPRQATAVPILTTTALNTEVDSAVNWLLGAWLQNENAFNHVGGAPRTSRNCPRGGRLVFSIASSAVSATTTRIHGVVTWFETTK